MYKMLFCKVDDDKCETWDRIPDGFRTQGYPVMQMIRIYDWVQLDLGDMWAWNIDCYHAEKFYTPTTDYSPNYYSVGGDIFLQDTSGYLHKTITESGRSYM